MSERRIEVTVRVIPMDTDQPIGEATTDLLFKNDENERSHVRSVELTAGLLYKRAGGVNLPTRPEEGGRG